MTKDVQHASDWMTVPEVAEFLRLPRTRAYELIHKGELPAVRVGERSIRINRAELETYLLNDCRIEVTTPGLAVSDPKGGKEK